MKKNESINFSFYRMIKVGGRLWRKKAAEAAKARWKINSSRRRGYLELEDEEFKDDDVLRYSAVLRNYSGITRKPKACPLRNGASRKKSHRRSNQQRRHPRRVTVTHESSQAKPILLPLKDLRQFNPDYYHEIVRNGTWIKLRIKLKLFLCLIHMSDQQ